jgi:hypothetical protein
MNRSLWNREVHYSIPRSLALASNWNVKKSHDILHIPFAKLIFILFAPTSSEWLFGQLTYKQEREYTYNVTFWRVPAANVAVEKQ